MVQRVVSLFSRGFFILGVGALLSTSLPAEQRSAAVTSHDDENHTCQASTYCRDGYRIWCSETGATCDSEQEDASWVWCAGYDEDGRTWESSDACRD